MWRALQASVVIVAVCAVLPFVAIDCWMAAGRVLDGKAPDGEE